MLLCLMLLTGCVSAIQERASFNYTYKGALAQAQGDWQAARRSYARAVINAEQANLSPGRRALLNYEYGRSLGVTCLFEKAEYELNLAYDLDKQAGAPLYLSLVELARLNLDQQKYAAAVVYYERAVPELDRADMAKKAPIAHADILDEYAVALSAIGRIADAQIANQQAKKLRDENPKGFSITDRTPYGKYCLHPKI